MDVRFRSMDVRTTFGHKMDIHRTSGAIWVRWLHKKNKHKCTKQEFLYFEGIVCNPDNNKSPVSVLYELAQKQGIHLDYEVTDDNGHPHEKVFTTKCQFGDLTVEGSGKSKKLSKRNASENMLEKLKYTKPSEYNTDVTIKKITKKKKKKVIKSSLEKFSVDAKNFVTSTWEAVFPSEDDKMVWMVPIMTVKDQRRKQMMDQKAT
ncbi:maternal effect protein staufen [Holotrichia oblita]|uniref:Maternal effect protein staufen n=1 Tax=Holotrichia oblita TaxID=644536 RepID=A0ACB9T9L2_HOLOL|nr:maternal effect protein staufen [Holotrichia oblita]